MSASHSRFSDRVKRALAIVWCAGDDAEDVSRRCLLIEAFAQFVKQPRILDGDDGLGTERLYQFNLSGREG